MKRLLAACVVAAALGGCNEQQGSTRSLSPIPPRTVALMSEKGMSKADPILVRLYKKEAELEVWKRTNGQYALLKSFPICRWSGQLGPKVKEGDRQAPEGFYTVSPAQMNPNSSYYLSFDTGYPNAFDRAHNRTGSHLMVHGDCSSRGCYAMTDEGISEVYALARESFAAGQRGFQLQAYPFRMNAENLARYRQDPNMAFWRNLKQGSDHFEITRREPKVAVCQGRYAFNTLGEDCKEDPTLAPTVAQKDDEDRKLVADLVAKGTPAVRLLYADGGQHESFRAKTPSSAFDAGSTFAILDTRPSRSVGQVSRPEALAEGPREIPMESAGKPSPRTGSVIAGASRRATGEALAEAAKPTSPKTGGRTRLASADSDAPIPLAAPAPESKALYGRMIAGVLGAGDGPAETAATRSEAAASQPADATVKRRPTAQARQATTGTTPPAKPRAAGDSAARSEQRLVPGAQATGPAPSGFRPN